MTRTRSTLAAWAWNDRSEPEEGGQQKWLFHGRRFYRSCGASLLSRKIPPVSQGPITTRFAPSPTGELHLGNARTALFSWLFARHHGGRFVLRIEDTDTERSKEAYTDGAHGGPAVDGPAVGCGPGPRARPARNTASRAAARSTRAIRPRSMRSGLTYPCYCTPLELDLSRKAQLAAGRPPRYAGTCRELSAEARVRKSAQGISPTTRFRVPTGRRVEFDDMVHGAQSFATDDIGDFILRRADGSAAFFFSNAIDDAEMGITHVLRGEDHLTNTPRQLLVLEALKLRAPTYGHLSLLVGADGSPLSKRHGATSVREFRERGYLPAALEQSSVPARAFEQRERRADAWMPWRARSRSSISGARRRASRSRSSMSGSAKSRITCRSRRASAGSRPRRRATSTPSAAARSSPPSVPTCCCRRTSRAGAKWCSARRRRSTKPRWRACAKPAPQFFRAAADAAATGGKLDAIVNAVKAATGAKGQALWKPLRLALTGTPEGPELAPLLLAMPDSAIHDRLNRFAA